MVRVIGSGANGWSRPRPVSPLDHAAGAQVPADLVMARTFTSAAAAQRNFLLGDSAPCAALRAAQPFFLPCLVWPNWAMTVAAVEKN